MSNINYRKIDNKNIYEIMRLSRTLTPEQQRNVASNARSIAEGSVYSNAYYRGIYLDDTPIGFFMISIPDEASISRGEPEFFLWRFMIAFDYQRKHYGSTVLDYIIEIGKEHGFTELVTSCHVGGVSPYEFYIKYGFKENGKMYDGETGLVIQI